MWRVLATKGCGSALVEAMLTLAGIPYSREEHHYGKPEGLAAIKQYNPLGQVPTVVLPDGAVMTESAAIALHVSELAPEAGLVPPPGDPLRRDALRWLVFLVAAVYPTFTYGDDPKAWGCGDELRESTDRRREAHWRQLEGIARAPWFLGDRWSVLDVYVSLMSRWRPKRAWFAAECPRLHAIAEAIDRDPRLAAVWAANF
ncbi:MAG: glutathione S-transferase family protein [Acidobacteriota bacterium]